MNQNSKRILTGLHQIQQENKIQPNRKEREEGRPMWPNIGFFLEIILFALGNLFTLSSLPEIFKYSKFEYIICLIVSYSGFTALKNLYKKNLDTDQLLKWEIVKKI